MECIRAAIANNKDIKVDAYLPRIGGDDLLLQRAFFDPNVTTTASYQDATTPSLNVFDIGAAGFTNQAVAVQSTQSFVESRYADRLHMGSTWYGDLLLARQTSTSANALFPESYYSQLEFGFTQPFLRNFGRKVNDSLIVVAANTQEIDRQTFKTRVINTLQEVEDAYWTLVFTRQDLEVKQEALRLAQQLLRVNQIKVQVGTLPPIDITLAEAGVAGREEAVIIAEAAIEAAQDRLRRVMGMDPKNPEWKAPIDPEEDLTIIERGVNLDEAVTTALENRPDLAAARMRIKNSDVDLSFRRNQLRYSLNATATYTLAGLAGDTGEIDIRDPNGVLLATFPPTNGPGIGDAWDSIPKRDFPTYEVAVTLGIPIGNRSAEAEYSKARLTREQRSIEYESAEQTAIVDVGNRVRQVLTDRKRIQAAEKNSFLQQKKVEAEQKKFENGMSTSFQVLEFQKDLAEARSAENAAKKDYRISLARLDQATGTLDRARNIEIRDSLYERPSGN